MQNELQKAFVNFADAMPHLLTQTAIRILKRII